MESHALVESLLVAAIFSLATSCAWPVLRMWWITRGVPGPPLWKYPLYGVSIAQGTQVVFKMVNYVMRTYGPTACCLWAGHKVVVFISSPEDARLVLTHPGVRNRDFHISKILDSLIDHTIASVKDDVARARRKKMLKAFSSKTLASYVEVFARKGDELCDRLDKMVGGRTFDVKDEFNILLVDTIFETGIGSRMNWCREEWEQVTKSVLAANLLIFRRLIRPWQLIDRLYAFLPEGKQLKSLRQTLITKLKQGFDKKNQTPNSIAGEIDFGDKIKHLSFTDIMRSTTSSFTADLTDDQLLEECLFMIASSMETTGKTMAYVLMMLGMHPEHQVKAAEEQRSIFKNSLRPATLEDLTKMPVLERIIKETLRLFPPVAGLTRELGADVEVTGGHTLPAGAMVIISNYMLHRDAASFEQPETFRPERWEDGGEPRHPYSYIPFAHGRRSCIGQQYAHLQVKMTLSRVLRQFRFTSGYTMRDLRRIEINVTNISVLGYEVEVFRRHNVCKRGSMTSETILPHG